MDFLNLILGFLVGSGLIVAIGPQNVFVIEQGLKKQFTFLVCLICSICDVVLISVGLYLFSYFDSYFSPTIELVLNLLLIIFLAHFIWNKIRESYHGVSFDLTKKRDTRKRILQKTLGFSLLNPHVYSDTVFFIGNISKNLEFDEKLFFGMGASMSSIIFFFTTGYLSRVFSEYQSNEKIMKKIDLIIILIMFTTLRLERKKQKTEKQKIKKDPDEIRQKILIVSQVLSKLGH